MRAARPGPGPRRGGPGSPTTRREATSPLRRPAAATAAATATTARPGRDASATGFWHIEPRLPAAALVDRDAVLELADEYHRRFPAFDPGRDWSDRRLHTLEALMAHVNRARLHAALVAKESAEAGTRKEDDKEDKEEETRGEDSKPRASARKPRG